MFFAGKKCLAIALGCGLLCLASSAAAQSNSTSDDHPGQPDPHTNVFMGGDHQKKEKNPTSRSVKGKVTDAKGQPLDNAVVTLENAATHTRLTFFTKHGGQYYFDNLSFTTDYKLYAEYKDIKSLVRTLSQYDRTPNIVRILEVDQPDVADKPAETAQKKP